MGFRSMTAKSLALALAIACVPAPVFAQSPDELKAARELFQEAFKDEQDKHYPEALEKFQRVAKVKESASVRYRIATVLAAMGRLREARDMYRALAAAKPSLPPSDHETSDSAAEKAAELDKRIPKLALRAPPDARVTVDGAPVPTANTAGPIELDPGEHVIAATAPGARPYQNTVPLVDGGGETSHVVALAKEPSPTTPSGGRKDTTLGWVAIGGGSAFVLAGAGFLLAREGAIDDMERSCPSNVCPTSTRSQVEDARSRAELFGPLGAAFGIIGLAAVGVGVYLLVRPHSRSAQHGLLLGPRLAF